MSEAVFQKHDYMKPVKKRWYHLKTSILGHLNTEEQLLPIYHHYLCISLLLDPKYKYWNSDDSSSQVPAYNMPNLDTLTNTISAFKETLQLSEDKIRHIELNTREQRQSPLWHVVWRYRITVSNFGAVMSHRVDTPPDSLVPCLYEFSTPAMQYGIEMEPTAIA